jgi:hypothetical protein
MIKNVHLGLIIIEEGGHVCGDPGLGSNHVRNLPGIF